MPPNHRSPVKRLDLLTLTRGIRGDKKRERNMAFIKSVLAAYNLRSLFLACELTLLLYNVVVNTDVPYLSVLDEIQEYYRHVFDVAQLTAAHVAKIQADMDYLERHRMITRVSKLYLHAYNVYLFFLKA